MNHLLHLMNAVALSHTVRTVLSEGSGSGASGSEAKLFQSSWHSSDETATVKIMWQLCPQCLCGIPEWKSGRGATHSKFDSFWYNVSSLKSLFLSSNLFKTTQWYAFPSQGLIYAACKWVENSGRCRLHHCMSSEISYSSSARTRGDTAGGGDESVSEVIKSASIPPLKTQLRESPLHDPRRALRQSTARWCLLSAAENFEIPLWEEGMTSVKLCRRALQKYGPRSTHTAAKIFGPVKFQLS